MKVAKSRTNTRMKGKNKDTGLGGFTIIEVVLVLAIAGLIFLMVFIALPALQRAQRDTQRRDDMARVSEAITQYQTNNNGKLPKVDGRELPAQDEAESDAGDLTKLCPKDSTSSSSAECLVKNYLNATNASVNEFADPDGWYYGMKIMDAKQETPKQPEFDHMIYVYTHAKCNGELAEKSDNARDHAVVYKLEGSGTYCQDNR